MAGNSNSATSTKLEVILTAEVTKKDDEKAIERVKRQVKTAKAVSQSELSQMDIALDSMRDRIAAIEKDADSTLAQITNARRELALAEKNFSDAKDIFEARF